MGGTKFMALSIFLVLTILGGWFAWRRNPMYSAARTVQVVVLFGGTIVIAIGAVIALVTWDVRLPLPVGIPMDVVAFFAAIALIISVSMHVFNPAPAPLPAGTKLVTVNRRKIIPWLKALGWVLLGMALLAIPLSWDGREVVGIFAVILVGFSAFMVMAAWLGGRRLDRALTAVLVEPWVHWKYTPEQWAAWSEQQVARQAAVEPQVPYKKLWLGTLFIALLLGIPTMFELPHGMVRIYVSAGILAVSALIVYLAAWSQKTAPARYRKRLRAAAPEAFFAQDGLFVEGEYSSWLGQEIYLLSAGIDAAEPSCLSLLFERVRPGTQGGIDITQVRKRVLIPAGSRQDLEKLQKELTATCRKARISLI